MCPVATAPGSDIISRCPGANRGGSGDEFFKHACEYGIEGIVSKLANSHYESTRNRNWLKVKCAKQQEFVISGYTPSSKVLPGAQAKIAHGRFGGDGFTLHSLRHTYITHLLSNGVDAPTVMQLSGHKSYQSFSVYLHRTDLGEKRDCLILEIVDQLLTTSGTLGTDENAEAQSAANAQTLTNHRTAYPAQLIA